MVCDWRHSHAAGHFFVAQWRLDLDSPGVGVTSCGQQL